MYTALGLLEINSCPGEGIRIFGKTHKFEQLRIYLDRVEVYIFEGVRAIWERARESGAF